MLQIYPRLIKSVDATGEQWKLYELDLPTANVCLILQYEISGCGIKLFKTSSIHLQKFFSEWY